jgi:hypothetical protein
MAGTHQKPSRGTRAARSWTGTRTTSPSPMNCSAKAHPASLTGATSTPVRPSAGHRNTMIPFTIAKAWTCLNRPGTKRSTHQQSARSWKTTHQDRTSATTAGRNIRPSASRRGAAKR